MVITTTADTVIKYLTNKESKRLSDLWQGTMGATNKKQISERIKNELIYSN